MSFGLFGVHNFDIKGSLYDGSTSNPSNKLTTRQYVADAIAASGGEWFSSVLEQTTTIPSSPSGGDRYLVGTGATGAWAGWDNYITEYDSTASAWSITSPEGDVGQPSAGGHVYIEGGSSNAGNTMIYRTSPSAGWVVAATASGALLKTQNLSDLDNVSTARTNLGLGDLATQNSVDLASDVTGQLPIANGGTGASSAADARTNLGLGTAAVLDAGVAVDDLLQLDGSLTTGQVVAYLSLDQLSVSTSNNYAWSSIYNGATWQKTSSGSAVSGTILSFEEGQSGAGTWIVSIDSGYASSLQNGDTLSASGYSFTFASRTNVNRVQGASQSQLHELVGDASTASNSAGMSYSNTGVACFNSADFSVSSGFVSLDAGLDSGDVMKLVGAASADDLVKAVSWSSFSGYIATNGIDTNNNTITLTSSPSGIVAGQILNSSGYNFEITAVNTSTYVVTVLDPNSNLGFLYGGGQVTIAGGDGFVSAGAYGTGANVDVATGTGSSAQGKLLKVSSSASLSSGNLLAIDSSGEIVAGSAGAQGTVTSIALQDDDGDDTTAITTSGVIKLLGAGSNGAMSTNVNTASDGIDIEVADASTTQKGVIAIASSSNYGGGTHAATVNFSSGADLGQGKFITLDSSAQIVTFQPDTFDLDGPVVKTSNGIEASPTMPSSVPSLKGAYVVDNASASADVSLSLPTSVVSTERGATVTFKLHSLNGNKVRISGGVVSGGGRMLIDGNDYVDLDQAGQSVTLHLSDVMGSNSQSTDKLCWSII